MTAMNGEFEAGVVVGDVGVAVDENNAALWSADIDAAVGAAAARIADGSIAVLDYTADAAAEGMAARANLAKHPRVIPRKIKGRSSGRPFCFGFGSVLVGFQPIN